MSPITIDLTRLQQQFGLTANEIDVLTESCINAVAGEIYSLWEAMAKKELKSTLPEYLQNLNIVDKGKLEKNIVLTGVVPNMVEQGAAPFDLKEGFKKSQAVQYTIPKYSRKGNMISAGGDWYLTIPFRIGTPGIVGQAGFSAEMPMSVYNVIKGKFAGSPLLKSEIPSPHDVPRSREAIYQNNQLLYAEYRHKNSIFEGMIKKTATYGSVQQNTYGTFRRAGKNSDPLSWIHKGIEARHLAEKAYEQVDVDTIVENLVSEYLDKIL
jgi:hypothetical protein